MSYEKELNALQKTIDELQEQKNNLEQSMKKEKVRPRAGSGENYWYIDDGEVDNSIDVFDEVDEVDDFRYKSGNYLPTKEGIEKYRDTLLAQQELKDLTEGYEFVAGKENWEISYLHSENKFLPYCALSLQSSQYTFETEEKLLNAINVMGHEKLKLALGVK